MKANELRIGNWVCADIVNEAGDESSEVYQLTYHALGILLNGLDVSKSMIHPIPLTEAWLSNFGFTLPDIHYLIWYKKGFGPFRVLFDIHLGHWQVGYSGGRVFRRIKYVHELQNIYFAITGEELIVI